MIKRGDDERGGGDGDEGGDLVIIGGITEGYWR